VFLSNKKRIPQITLFLGIAASALILLLAIGVPNLNNNLGDADGRRGRPDKSW
jgi:hypothetical protein